jgi:hypothetical protein
MLSRQVDEQMAKWKQIVATDVPVYNDTVKKLDVPAVVLTKSGEAAGAATQPKQQEDDEQ